jgi:hypothetical protein
MVISPCTSVVGFSGLQQCTDDRHSAQSNYGPTELVLRPAAKTHRIRVRTRASLADSKPVAEEK